MSLCDKCGRQVDLANDASLLDAIVFGEPVSILFHGARHLLPVVEDGVVVCEGSPSRLQYLQGQPRDTRGFPYDPNMEIPYREAYAAIQQKYALVESE
jgi:hypothetical protein